MAFTKITNSELNSRGATTLPNQPTISAAALKQEFDAPAKEIVAPKFNNLIDELEADTAGASIGLQAPSRRTGSTVKAVVDAISQDLVTVEGKLNGVTNAGLLDAIYLKHGHENKALLDTYDQTNEDIKDAVNQKHSHSNKSVLDKWSESAGGAPMYNGQVMTGDMYSSEYDPDSTVKNAGGIESYVTNGLGTKVDKVDGKGLSTNDFTDTLKTKLDGIATGAEVNVQSDWNQTNNTNDDFIKNKPTLGTASSKNSTSVVTDSTDLVESGAVYDALGFGNKNYNSTKYNDITSHGVIFTVNADRTITAQNDNDNVSGSYVAISKYFSVPNDMTLKLTGGVNDTCVVYLYDYTTSTKVSGDVGSGEEEVSLVANHSYGVNVWVKKGALLPNPIVFKPMLSKDGGAYEPYHASVDSCKVGWDVAEKSVKENYFDLFLPLTLTSNTTSTITDNGYRIQNSTAGTAKRAIWNYPLVKNEDFVLSCIVAKTSGEARIHIYGDNTTKIIEVNDIADGKVSIPFNAGNYDTVGIRFYSSGSTSETGDVTYKDIMIRPASISDSTYVPFIYDNTELEAKKADNSVIAPVENDTTVQKSGGYAAGSHAIRNGAFITWKNAKAQGETINDASDYTSGDVASYLNIETAQFTTRTISEITFTRNDIERYGKVVNFKLGFDVANDITLSSAILASTSMIPFTTSLDFFAYDTTLRTVLPAVFTLSSTGGFVFTGEIPAGSYLLTGIYICK